MSSRSQRSSVGWRDPDSGPTRREYHHGLRSSCETNQSVCIGGVVGCAWGHGLQDRPLAIDGEAIDALDVAACLFIGSLENYTQICANQSREIE